MNLKPTDVPSGFFARFLIFTPPYSEDMPPALPQGNLNLVMPEEEVFKNHLESIFAKIGEKRMYALSGQAKRSFNDFHKAIYNESKQYGEHAQEILQPYLKRWSPDLLKIAMILQLFVDADTELIDELSILMAYNILYPAMRSTAMLLEKELGESDYQRKCRIVFDWVCGRIKKTGNSVKRQEIMSSRKLKNGSKEYDSVLQTLIEEGKIELKKTSSKKKDDEYILVEKIEVN